jgi:hypothetical protein
MISPPPYPEPTMDLNSTEDSGNFDVLDDYLARVDGLHEKTTRLALQQRAVCDTLRRTAEALRRLADASRR